MHSKDSELIELYSSLPRLTYDQIAERLDIKATKVKKTIYLMQQRNILKRRFETKTRKKPTTQQLDRMIFIEQQRKLGLTWHQIGSSVGLSKQAIHNYVGLHLPHLRGNRPVVVRDNSKLISLYNTFPRLTYKQMSDKLGISCSTVAQRLNVLQNQGLIKSRLIEGGGLEFTTERYERIRLIYNMRKAGLSWHDIALTFGEKYRTVYKFGARYMQKYIAILENDAIC